MTITYIVSTLIQVLHTYKTIYNTSRNIKRNTHQQIVQLLLLSINTLVVQLKKDLVFNNYCANKRNGQFFTTTPVS